MPKPGKPKLGASLKHLARKAGRWLGLAAATPAAKHTTCVEVDRFDQMAFNEVKQAAPAITDLADDLNQQFDHTSDLLADVFATAYKAAPKLRDRDTVADSRAVNHTVMAAMIDSPELVDLRRETAGDPYAAAMAVVAQQHHLRSLLETTKPAHDQAQAAEAARQEADAAAQAVAEAVEAAGESADGDGTVPAEDAAAVTAAITAAQTADDAAAAAAAAAQTAADRSGPAVRAVVRRALAAAADSATEDAAIMRAWGVEPGQLQRMNFDQRAALAQRLSGNRLSEFAELIGRFRQMASGERARRVENVPGELVGITLGDDLSRLVPSETAALGVPEMRAIFAARYAEQQLMLFDQEGETETGHGAIIACIDCSGSMSGAGEAWAKACALALLDQARAAGRDFTAILFSSAHQTARFSFPGGCADINTVVDMAETFFNGGTDFETPLSEAINILADEHDRTGRTRGDIVLITDGEADVSTEWMGTWNRAKHAFEFRTFGVSIDTDPHWRGYGSTGVMDALCDNLRSIADLTDPDTTADLFRTI